MSATAPARTPERTRAISEHTYRRLSAPAAPRAFEGDRQSAFEALRLWQRLTAALVSAYVEGEHDRLKRLRRIRRRAAERAEARYNRLTPAPRLPLGNLHHDPTARRKHAEAAQLRAA